MEAVVAPLNIDASSPIGSPTVMQPQPTTSNVPPDLAADGVVLAVLCGVTAYWWPCFYGNSVNGQDRYWMIGFDGQSIYTLSGVVGGKQPTPRPKSVKVKSQNTVWDQGVFNIRSKINKRQREEGYYMLDPEGHKVELTGKQGVNDVKLAHPDFMLADEYDPNRPLDFARGVGASYKLDGERGMAAIHEGVVRLMTRSNKYMKFMEHVEQALIAWFARLPAGTHVDGEMYKHGWTINKISGICRRTVNRHEETVLLEYHVFDIILPPGLIATPYWQRIAMLMDIAKELGLMQVAPDGSQQWYGPIRIVGYTVLSNDADVPIYHDMVKAAGYEGAMIRDLQAEYQQKRCSAIQKYKEFLEEEVEIIGVDFEENMGKRLAMFWVRDARGQQLRVRPMGSFPQREMWFQHPELVVGRRDYTIVHFELSKEKGVQRFPIGKRFRS